jgi:recombination protein RecA
LVQKSGSWYSYGDTRIGQGREAARQFLAANPDVTGEIELKIREALGLIPGSEGSEEAGTEGDKAESDD